MRMIAAVMAEQGLPKPYAQSRPFAIEEVELEGPGQGEVLIEVRAGGLCHSDLSQVAGQRKRKLPVVGGHEGAGIVRETGPGVKGLSVGDHVVMSGAPGCGRCRTCGQNRPNLCEGSGSARAQGLLPNGERRLSLNGDALYHYSGLSCFAQYAVVMPDALIRVDPDIPLDVAALFGCGVVTGAGAVFNAAQVPPGRSVAIIGLGGVGLSAVMAARLSGASEIIGVDLVEEKFPLARELGCTHTLSAREAGLAEKVKDLTGGGVDFAFEVSGSEPAVATAFDITRRGGEIVGVGLGVMEDTYRYPHTRLVAEEKVMRGSFMGSGNAIGDIPRYMKYFQEGRMPVDRLMSGTLAFDDLNGALDLLDRGAVMREVLLPNP
ncbi:zinc-binding dehydrogenase [Streptomyces sp. NPDC002790]|uniref:zinc-binding dehydrogenase n=1 Tax=Streptomyces sp. NPDC002790 TaxID=3154431 RepID=UPI00331D0D92